MFIKGFDVSTLIEERACGARYFDGERQEDALKILAAKGGNSLRLRLWLDPYDKDGAPYGAGTSDFAKLVQLAKEGKALGMGYLLDFHYSDFWTDPGKQYLPKAWEDFTLEEVEQALYDYTVKTLQDLAALDLLPDMVQVGNEITNGILWPYGKWENTDTLISFINTGIRAVKSVCPDMKIMLHLDCGGNNARCREWFDAFVKKGEDFDVIGLSYYPFWHGTIDDLTFNMNDLAARYQKDIVVAEVSMGFTMEDYRPYEGLDASCGKGMATKEHLLAGLDFPMTKQGQADFMHRVLERIAAIPEGRGKGFYYWEPAWVPVPGCGWATEASLLYMNDPGPCGNEWANQALFDYQGKALPALDVISAF